MSFLQTGALNVQTAIVAVVVVSLLILGAALRIIWRLKGKVPVVVVSKPWKKFSRRDYRGAGQSAESLLAWGKALNSESVESDKVVGDFVVGALAEFFSGVSLARGVLTIADRFYDTVPFMRTGRARIIVRAEDPSAPDAYTVDYKITARGGFGNARRIRGVLRGDDVSLLLENVAVIHMHHERRHSGHLRVNPVDTVSREGPLLAYIDVLRELRKESTAPLDEIPKDMLSGVFERVANEELKGALIALEKMISREKYSEVIDQVRLAYLLASLLAENYVNDALAENVIGDLEQIENACTTLLGNEATFRAIGVDGRLVIRALGFEVRVQLARHYAMRNHRYASSSDTDEAVDWRNKGIEYARSVSSEVLQALDANGDSFGAAELRFLRSQVIDLYVRARRMEAFCAHCREEVEDLLEGIVLYERLFEDLSSHDPVSNPLASLSAGQLMMRNGSVASSVEAWIAESEAMARNNFGYTLLLAGCVSSIRGHETRSHTWQAEEEVSFNRTPREYITEAIQQFQRALDGAEHDPTAEGRNVRTYSHSNRGYARAITGDFDGALEDNAKAIKNHVEHSIDSYYFEGCVERAFICSLAANARHALGHRDHAEQTLNQILDQNPLDLKPRRICNQAKLCVVRAVAAQAIDSSKADALLKQIESAHPNGDGEGAIDDRDYSKQRRDAVRVLSIVLDAIAVPSTPNVA